MEIFVFQIEWYGQFWGRVSWDLPCVWESVYENQWQPVPTVQTGSAVSKETVRHSKHLHRNGFQSMSWWIRLAGMEENSLRVPSYSLSMSLIAWVYFSEISLWKIHFLLKLWLGQTGDAISVDQLKNGFTITAAISIIITVTVSSL